VEDIEGYTVTKIDDGFGTSWATTSVIGTDNNLAGISVTTLGVGAGSRSMIIRYVKDLITTDITIVQNE
jgi:hypothetical protein